MFQKTALWSWSTGAPSQTCQHARRQLKGQMLYQEMPRGHRSATMSYFYPILLTRQTDDSGIQSSSSDTCEAHWRPPGGLGPSLWTSASVWQPPLLLWEQVLCPLLPSTLPVVLLSWQPPPSCGNTLALCSGAPTLPLKIQMPLLWKGLLTDA